MAILKKIFSAYDNKIFGYYNKPISKEERFKILLVMEIIYLINYSASDKIKKRNKYDEGEFMIQHKYEIKNINKKYEIKIDKYKQFLNKFISKSIFDNKIQLVTNEINNRGIDLSLVKENINEYTDKVKKEIYSIKRNDIYNLIKKFIKNLYLIEKERLYFVNKFKISININILEHIFNKTNNDQFIFLYYLNIIYSFIIKSILELSLFIRSENEIIDITNIIINLNEISFLINNTKNIFNILLFIGLVNSVILNKEQSEYLNNEIDNLEKKQQQNHFQEILMGKGKSSVIIPTIAIINLLNHSNKNVFVIVPQNLILQTYKYFINIISSYFNIYIFMTNNIDLNNYVDETENCINIISCENIRDFIINNYNSFDKITFKNRLYIIDEIHLICDPMNCETNIINKSANLLQKLSPTNNSNFIFELLFNLIKNLYFEERFTFENTEIIGHKIYKEFYFDFLMDKHKDLILDLVKQMFSGKEQFIKLFEEFKNGSFKEYLLSLVKENIDTKMLYFINFIYSIFYVSLPNMCNMINNKNFGLFNDKKIKSFFIVCPFLSLNTPLKTSEFSDYYMSIMLTIIAYLNNDVRIDDLEIFLDFCISKVKISKYDENTKFFRIIKKYYGDFYGIDISKYSLETGFYLSQKYKLKSNLINKTNEIIKIEFIKDYLILYIFPKYFSSLTETQINFTNYDFFSDLITNKVFGYTGTLQTIQPPLVYKNQILIKKRKNINSEICFGLGNMMEKKEANIKHINNNDLINSDLLNEIIKILKTEEYNALIDVGGLLIQFNTIKIMKEIYTNLNNHKKYKNINCFVFILDDEKYIYNADGSYIKFNDSPCSINNIFVYYSNNYITGIDFKLKSNALGLITVKNDTTFETLSQGGFRLRMLNPIGHQTLDYVIFNSNINTFRDLINITINNQYKLYENKNNLYKYQLLKSLVRNTLDIDDEIINTYGNKTEISDVDSIIKTINKINFDKYYEFINKIYKDDLDIYNIVFEKINEEKNKSELIPIQINISEEISEEISSEIERTIDIVKINTNSSFMIQKIPFNNIASFTNPNFFGCNVKNNIISNYDGNYKVVDEILSKYIIDNNISDNEKIMKNNLYMSSYLSRFVKQFFETSIVENKILIKNTLNVFMILVNINNLNTTSIIISLEEFLFMCNQKDVKYELTENSLLYAIDIYGNVFKFNIPINKFELQPTNEITKNTQLRYNPHITLFLAMYDHNYIEYDRIIHLYYRFKFNTNPYEIVNTTINSNIEKNKFFNACKNELANYGIIKNESMIDSFEYTYLQTLKREDVTQIVKEITKNFDAIINKKEKMSTLDYYILQIKQFIKQLICENDDCENIDFDNFNDIEMLNSIIKTIKYFKSLDEAVQKGGLSKYYRKYLKYKSKYLKLKKLN